MHSLAFYFFASEIYIRKFQLLLVLLPKIAQYSKYYHGKSLYPLQLKKSFSS